MKVEGYKTVEWEDGKRVLDKSSRQKLTDGDRNVGDRKGMTTFLENRGVTTNKLNTTQRKVLT